MSHFGLCAVYIRESYIRFKTTEERLNPWAISTIIEFDSNDTLNDGIMVNLN